ncbi:MAG: lipid-A-disaccharide synthase, partial [Muribaculaceae bacterium]|nr:lipid-A-disaccharide synthase [Muribaculaceae bacterium]
QFPQYRGVVAGAPGIDPGYYAQFTSLPVVHGSTLDLLANARAALVTSGTATLEAALVGVPQVALYQGGGSEMLYKIMKRVLKIEYVTLPNLIAGQQVIPELLMHLCTADAAAAELGKILPDREARTQMTEGYRRIRTILGGNAASETVASEIFRILSENV